MKQKLLYVLIPIILIASFLIGFIFYKYPNILTRTDVFEKSLFILDSNQRPTKEINWGVYKEPYIGQILNNADQFILSGVINDIKLVNDTYWVSVILPNGSTSIRIGNKNQSVSLQEKLVTEDTTSIYLNHYPTNITFDVKKIDVASELLKKNKGKIISIRFLYTNNKQEQSNYYQELKSKECNNDNQCMGSIDQLHGLLDNTHNFLYNQQQSTEIGFLINNIII